MKISDEILALLRRSTTNGPRLYLAGPRMPARQYQQVENVIEGAGGQWDKRSGTHIFPGDAATAIAALLATGCVTTRREARTASQYFPTPTELAHRLVQLADVRPATEVLEPSAGRGAIATALAAAGAVVDCIERDPEHANVLQSTGVARTVLIADFLTVPPEATYDRVVMNPPFTKGADIAHVTHALRFLKPDGVLVAVMSASVAYQGGAAAEFRALVERQGGSVEVVPAGVFAQSGTDVGTLLVTIPVTARPGASSVVWAPQVPTPDADDFGDPAEIAAEIAADLRKALDAFERVARSLRKTQDAPPPTEGRAIQDSPQLAFDFDTAV